MVWAVPLVAGCTELPLTAKQDVDRARDAYLKRDYQTARTTLDGVLGSYGHYTGAAEAYFLRSKILAETSNRAAALRDARRCIELSRDKSLTARAHASAGALEFEAGNKAAALDHYAEALKGLPERPPADVIRFRYATCLMHVGRWKDARRELATVLQRYPSGDIAEHARRLQAWPGDYFVIQCGAFRDRASATKQVNQLQRAGVSARVESMSRQGQALQTVVVGEYSTYSAAKAALPPVKSRVSGAVIAP